MRYSILYLFILLLLSCHQLHPTVPDTNKQTFDKFIPNEHFFYQRTYPDLTFDIRTYTKSIRQAQIDDNVYTSQRRSTQVWEIQGPGNLGARINTIAIHPSNSKIIYVGFSGGGIYKTMDGGESWDPIFDDNRFLSIGDIVLDPSNPDVVFVGTGDPNISGYPFIGDGIYRSINGGREWEVLGLDHVGIISKIIIHPSDSDIIYVSTMGTPFERSEHRGLYRTTNGGKTWQKILYISDQTGIIDMIMHPTNPEILYAAGWDRIRNYQESVTYGQGARIHRSLDGGDSWKELSGGLPLKQASRIGLAAAPSEPDCLYAMYVDTTHELQAIYVSDDLGEHWETINTSPDKKLPANVLGGFGWYFGKIRIDPQNKEIIYLLGVDLYRRISRTGDWEIAAPDWWKNQVHADKHDLIFVGNDTIFLATDGGLYRSDNLGGHWQDIENIPAAQFYRVAYNPHQPDVFFGGTQDNGTISGNRELINAWSRIYIGDGFRLIFDPNDPDIYYAESQFGNLVVTTDGGASFRSATQGIDPKDLKNWDLPVIMSHHNPKVLYYATDRVYRNISGPKVLFKPISEVLAEKIVYLDMTNNISALAESPFDSTILFAGTGDGNLWKGILNTEITWNRIGITLPDRYITSIHFSPTYPGHIYVTQSGYKSGEYLPHIHRSEDFGDTWVDLGPELPPLAINDLFVLPNNEDQILFVATDAGVYFSENSGLTWKRLGTNMPYIAVYDLEYNPDHNLLIAGTFGKSIQTYDLAQEGISLNPSTAFEQLTPAAGLKVYPIPASEVLNIDWNISDEIQIHIFKSNGELMLISSFTKNQVDIQALPKGIYFMTLKDQRSGEVVQSKFIKI